MVNHEEGALMTRADDLAVTDRTRIRRIGERQVTDRAMMYTILDHALIAHVAVVRDGLPVVLPLACARDGDSLLLHGSTGAGLLRDAASGAPIAVGVTLLDGLVVARSVFDSSMNYRSLVAFGVPEVLEGQAKEQALQRLVEHLLPGRWDEVRPSSQRELATTLVLRLWLDEVSVKVRDEAVTADPDGEDRTVWAGVLPTLTVAGDPVCHGDVPPDVDVPSSVRTAAERLRAEAHRIQAAAVRAARRHPAVG
jgi:nitroimidazol reductase NimA-like FMN-containing flavoprotein (pyridoxamine 5'-phosphate oxidase superfamily)